MADLDYHCPATRKPIGTSVPAEMAEKADIIMLEVEKCPVCGQEHVLGEDDLYAAEDEVQ